MENVDHLIAFQGLVLFKYRWPANNQQQGMKVAYPVYWIMDNYMLI